MAIRILVSGRVQGVGYRVWLQNAAADQGLTGWVRNLADGRVEAMLHGADEAVRSVIEKASGGPPAAKVEDVAQRPATEDEVRLAGDGFRVLPTP